MLFFAALLTASIASAQANASLNLITLNSGQVNVGSVVDVQVTIGNTGPTASIGINRVRAVISIPSICTALPNVEQTGLPAGWTITNNSGNTITVCNGSDVIGVGVQRQVFIKIRGVSAGGPSTINGSLLFSNGTSCTLPGTLAGDNNADNTGTTSVTVNAVAPCTLGVSATAGTITCNGGTTTITATATNATGAVQYSLNGGTFQSANTFTVTAGTYTITAREVTNNSCTATTSPVIIADPPQLPAPVISIVQPSCTVSTGTITVTSSTAGLTFSLDGGTYTAYPADGYTVTPGPHTLTYQNAGGCISAAADADIDAGATAPSAPTLNAVHPTCTVATGTITITSSAAGLTFSLDGGSFVAYPVGGYIVAAGAHAIIAQNVAGCTSSASAIIVNPQPPVPAAPAIGTITQPSCAVSTGSVELTGLPAGNWTINPGAITGSTTTFIINDLDPGIYSYTATNAVGCTSPASVNIVVDNVPGAPGAPAVTLTQPTCTVATGNITITSVTTGLTFSLDGTNYAVYPAGGYNVPTGSYTITAQNASGCISAFTHVTVDPQPATPATPTVDVTHPTCLLPGGNITVTSSTTGLLFSLDGGAYAAYPAGGYDVAPGAHTVIARNGSNCPSPAANVTINPLPASPTVSVNAGTISCFNGFSAVTVTATSGTAPYEYAVNAFPYEPFNTYSLQASTYTFRVRDANGCVGSSDVTIDQPAAIVATSSAETPLPCSTTTSFTVTTSGGVAPLQFSLNGGAFQPTNTFSVGGGSHVVTVKDANNCTVQTAPVIVAIPGSINISVTAARITRCGGTSQVVVTATGGTPPYASGTGTFTKGAGTWSFAVTDAAGCTGSKEIFIEPPGCMELLVYPNPGRTGNITINHSIAAAGSTMQVFEINGALVMNKQVPPDAFLTTLDINKLAAGTYMIVFLNGSERNERKATLFVKSN